MTQQALADVMKARGWKWSQATVWSIEKGERPLRLAEAVDLVDVLDLEGVKELITTPLVTMSWQRLSLVAQAERALEVATQEFMRAQFDLATVADMVDSEGLPLPDVDEDLEARLEQTPEQIIQKLTMRQKFAALEFPQEPREHFANGAKYLQLLWRHNPGSLGMTFREDTNGKHQTEA